MKSLEKDRTRRYATVGDLRRISRDIWTICRSWQTSPSSRYRIQKFVRRNRLAVVAAATLVAAPQREHVVSSPVQNIRRECGRDQLPDVTDRES